jgi:endonuclease YncB( thermonuclease family)
LQVATPYVFTSPYIFGRTNVSLHLVQKGLATVYTQSGAAYGSAGIFVRTFRWMMGRDKLPVTKTSFFDRLFPISGEARLKKAMAKAKRKKRGVWSLKNFETPEDYKKRIKLGQS